MSAPPSTAEGAEARPWREVPPAQVLLLASVFVVASCGLVYELCAGALASVLLGDSILQFSTIIGTYLFAMGVGSYASRWVQGALVPQFLRIELLVGLIGGFMPAALLAAHSSLPVSATGPFRVLLYGVVLLVGMLVGLEIPLVMRILHRSLRGGYALKDLVAEVLTFDYLGALVVAVAFPLLLVPHLGLVRTGLVFGLLNTAVALLAIWMFRAELRRVAAFTGATLAVGALLVLGLWGAERLTSWADERFYGDQIVLKEQTPYQRIVVTQSQAGTRLFLNGHLQFHSRDEYRYHEALVHPALAGAVAPREVLVLGGGDGMAVREVLKHPGVQRVTLVELDPVMIERFRHDARLVRLNDGALSSPKLRIVQADAFSWLDTHDEVFDAVVVDFPDPTSHALGKLYTTTFYRVMAQRLSASGFAVVQTTSPLVARASFWTVEATLRAAGLHTAPYHAHVPSFGEWGFIIAGHRAYPAAAAAAHLPPGLRFLQPASLPALFDFPPDMARVPAQPNRLTEQHLVTLFESEWGRVQP